jgi:hypothetical protein
MKKGKEETFTRIPVGKIVSESNRKHGGMGNIDILAESIKTEGLINPPTVADCGDGTYRIVTGRRRIEAVRQLKWKEGMMEHIKIYKEELTYPVTIEVKHSETGNQASALSLSMGEAKELLVKLHGFIYKEEN